VTAAIKDSVSPHCFVDELLNAELAAHEERQVRTSLRLSGLPLGRTLGNIDFSFQPSVDRAAIEILAICGWIREGSKCQWAPHSSRERRKRSSSRSSPRQPASSAALHDSRGEVPGPANPGAVRRRQPPICTPLWVPAGPDSAGKDGRGGEDVPQAAERSPSPRRFPAPPGEVVRV
jgi:hypothetical protein